MPNLTEKRQIVRIAEEVFEAKLEEFQEVHNTVREAAKKQFIEDKKREAAPLVKKAEKLAKELSDVYDQLAAMERITPTRDYYGNAKAEKRFFTGIDVDAWPSQQLFNEDWNAKSKKAREALRAFKLATWTDAEDAMKDLVSQLETIFGK